MSIVCCVGVLLEYCVLCRFFCLSIARCVGVLLECCALCAHVALISHSSNPHPPLPFPPLLSPPQCPGRTPATSRRPGRALLRWSRRSLLRPRGPGPSSSCPVSSPLSLSLSLSVSSMIARLSQCSQIKLGVLRSPGVLRSDREFSDQTGYSQIRLGVPRSDWVFPAPSGAPDEARGFRMRPHPFPIRSSCSGHISAQQPVVCSAKRTLCRACDAHVCV